jgi:hypothetical protein
MVARKILSLPVNEHSRHIRSSTMKRDEQDKAGRGIINLIIKIFSQEIEGTESRSQNVRTIAASAIFGALATGTALLRQKLCSLATGEWPKRQRADSARSIVALRGATA